MRTEEQDQRHLEQWRMPYENDYENAKKRRSRYMSELARKSHSSESALKGAATKLKKDPNYFKRIGSKGGKAKRDNIDETDR